MRKTIIKCDICQKEISKSAMLEIPIIRHSDNGNSLELHRFDDLCDECLNELGNTMSKKYYEMCDQYGNSGIHAIEVN